MPLESFKLDWFQVLNGLGPNDGLTAGTKVKVVTP